MLTIEIFHRFQKKIVRFLKILSLIHCSQAKIKGFFAIVVCEIYHKQNDNWMFDKLPKNVHITSLFEVYVCIVWIFSVEFISDERTQY